MDSGKIEEEVDDGYQPNGKQHPWDMKEEKVFDSRSGEILQQELVQMGRNEELDLTEKIGLASTRMPQLRSVSPRRRASSAQQMSACDSDTFTGQVDMGSKLLNCFLHNAMK